MSDTTGTPALLLLVLRLGLNDKPAAFLHRVTRTVS